MRSFKEWSSSFDEARSLSEYVQRWMPNEYERDDSQTVDRSSVRSDTKTVDVNDFYEKIFRKNYFQEFRISVNLTMRAREWARWCRSATKFM